MPAVTTPDVIGNYKGSYAGGTETFTFRKDGTFTQKLTKSYGKVIYDSSGTWYLASAKPDYVVMVPFYDCFDEGEEGKIRNYGSEDERLIDNRL